jgi:hypothetical protein
MILLPHDFPEPERLDAEGGEQIVVERPIPTLESLAKAVDEVKRSRIKLIESIAYATDAFASLAEAFENINFEDLE